MTTEVSETAFSNDLTVPTTIGTYRIVMAYLESEHGEAKTGDLEHTSCNPSSEIAIGEDAPEEPPTTTARLALALLLIGIFTAVFLVRSHPASRIAVVCTEHIKWHRLHLTRQLCQLPFPRSPTSFKVLIR